MSKVKKILLIGGEGFIGMNLADYLARSFSCYSIGPRKSIFSSKNRIFIKKDPYECQIKSKYDVIIHLVDRREEEKKLWKLEKDLIKNLSSVSFQQFIFISSAAVYANPESDYAKRKILLEKIYSSVFNREVKVAILRLFNAYGPYQLPGRPGSLVSNLLTDYLKKRKTEINDLGAKRDFIYSKDIAMQIKKVIESGFSGLDDLATNKLTSISQLIKIIEQKVIADSLLLENNNQIEKIKIKAGKSRLSGGTVFTPKEMALKKTYDFYCQNLSKIK